ncbi:MAG: PucR family transcriptional regulator [Acholeplasmataceae bacterium]|nr:MAG: PucR family transcriptional regulator [Acholeplasmataceae bacterium]
MYRYILIESKKDIKSEEDLMISFFSEILSISTFERQSHMLVMCFEHAIDMSLSDIILNMIADTYSDLRMYASHVFDNTQQRDNHIRFIKKQLAQIEFNKHAYLDDKIILKEALDRLDDKIKAFMLRKYHQDAMMHDTLKAYLEANQNMSVAAKQLYVHRNTLIQRIDKFNQVTGFDPRRFTDAFLIYHLLD